MFIQIYLIAWIPVFLGLKLVINGNHYSTALFNFTTQALKINVTMVVVIDGKITIDGKFYETEPWHISHSRYVLIVMFSVFPKQSDTVQCTVSFIIRTSNWRITLLLSRYSSLKKAGSKGSSSIEQFTEHGGEEHCATAINFVFGPSVTVPLGASSM